MCSTVREREREQVTRQQAGNDEARGREESGGRQAYGEREREGAAEEMKLGTGSDPEERPNLNTELHYESGERREQMLKLTTCTPFSLTGTKCISFLIRVHTWRFRC